MTNSGTLISADSLTSLAAELGQIGQSLVKLSKNLKKITTSKAVSVAKVTPKTDPEMFTKKFLKTVRQSRKDFEQGDFVDYREFRKTLGLK